MQYSDLIYELDRQNSYNKEEGLPSSEKLITYYMEMLNNSLFIGKNKIVLQNYEKLLSECQMKLSKFLSKEDKERIM